MSDRCSMVFTVLLFTFIFTLGCIHNENQLEPYESEPHTPVPTPNDIKATTTATENAPNEGLTTPKEYQLSYALRTVGNEVIIYSRGEDIYYVKSLKVYVDGKICAREVYPTLGEETVCGNLERGEHRIVVEVEFRDGTKQIVLDRTVSVSPKYEVKFEAYPYYSYSHEKSAVKIKYLGGKDSSELRRFNVKVGDFCSMSFYNPSTGDYLVCDGISQGTYHVVVEAEFFDGSKQVVLDKYITVISYY